MYHLSSESQRFKIKVSAGLGPSEECEGRSVPSISLNCCGLLAIIGIPWPVEASPQSLPSSSHGSPCVCLGVQISPFHKDTRHVRSEPTLLQPHLDELHLQRPYSQIRSHCEILGAKTLMSEF